ncbi:hypothetical protein B0T09DRAFT_317436 [Sordaria sp. MPI-SDFR-AT-0083]|nr:hypothetical protein B0T09DRAFT_317436 [Sordaria sp. MPI-SDFR-AT-0083]
MDRKIHDREKARKSGQVQVGNNDDDNDDDDDIPRSPSFVQAAGSDIIISNIAVISVLRPSLEHLLPRPHFTTRNLKFWTGRFGDEVHAPQILLQDSHPGLPKNVENGRSRKTQNETGKEAFGRRRPGKTRNGKNCKKLQDCKCGTIAGRSVATITSLGNALGINSIGQSQPVLPNDNPESRFRLPQFFRYIQHAFLLQYAAAVSLVGRRISLRLWERSREVWQ